MTIACAGSHGEPCVCCFSPKTINISLSAISVYRLSASVPYRQSKPFCEDSCTHHYCLHCGILAVKGYTCKCLRLYKQRQTPMSRDVLKLTLKLYVDCIVWRCLYNRVNCIDYVVSLSVACDFTVIGSNTFKYSCWLHIWSHSVIFDLIFAFTLVNSICLCNGPFMLSLPTSF